MKNVLTLQMTDFRRGIQSLPHATICSQGINQMLEGK